MATIILGPWLAESPTLGDDQTRFSIWISLLFYAIAAAGMLSGNRGGWVRICWSLAWVAYLIHLGMAFHHYHHWSHAEAMRHTHERSGFGEGIFASHAFTLVWTGDVLARWLFRSWQRPRWLGWALHGYMAFMIFNATVIYETGFIRWAGIAMFAILGALLVRR